MKRMLKYHTSFLFLFLMDSEARQLQGREELG
jgi:hypothetical protein